MGFLLGVGVLYLFQKSQPVGPVAKAPEWEKRHAAFSDSFRVSLAPALEEIGIWRELIREQRPSGQELCHRIRVRVPRDLSLLVCNLEITRLVHRLNGTMISAQEDLKNAAVVMKVGMGEVPTDVVTLVPDEQITRRVGSIAILLDDFGTQKAKRIEAFCRIPQRLTLSVFPNGQRSGEIAEAVHQSGHQVMIHLPMEPHEYPDTDPGEDAIYVRQSAEEVRGRTKTAIGTVPHAVGLNNHMGSRATEDEQVMQAVLGEVKRNKLFFIDSYTSGKSVALAVAKGMPVPCAKRDVFLDHEDDPQAIRTALAKLANLAVQNGSALGIGHPRLHTLNVLKEELPKLERQGFQFVWASELAR
ncbi:MAG: divergent polysaccharide deacetylase family protein [Candidatus Latescibacterota bacterium]